MSLPDLNFQPAPGSAIAPSVPVSYTYSGVTGGVAVRLLVGSFKGGADVADVSVVAPAPVGFTPPATFDTLHVRVLVEEASALVYEWVHHVGTVERADPQIAMELEIGWLYDNWRHSLIGAYQDVPDHQDHGHDLICPVIQSEQPIDLDGLNDATIAPFSVDDVKGYTANGARVRGVGYLRCAILPIRTEQITPGECGEIQQDVVLAIEICTEARRGPKLANLYAGAITKLFSLVDLKVEEGQFTMIRQMDPPDPTPSFQGQDETWAYHRIDIPLQRFGRAVAA